MEPTEDNCEEDTIKVFITTAGGVLAALALLVEASVITFACYRWCASVERRKVQTNMPDGCYEDASRRVDEIVQSLTNVKSNATITRRQRK